MWPICYAQELNGASKFAGASVTGPYASLTCWNADHHCKTRLVAGVVAGQALEVRGVLHNLLIRAGGGGCQHRELGKRERLVV